MKCRLCDKPATHRIMIAIKCYELCTEHKNEVGHFRNLLNLFETPKTNFPDMFVYELKESDGQSK